MAKEREPSVVGSHAAAVVGDRDEGRAPVPDLDAHAGGPGVEGIFHQLFHHRGGALHHLARRNLVDQVVGQHAHTGRRNQETLPSPVGYHALRQGVKPGWFGGALLPGLVTDSQIS